MQYALLDYLKCPLTKTTLQFRLIEEFTKNYGGETITEVKDGLLFSEAGFIFPVINGIPRLLIEAHDDYPDFLSAHLPDFITYKQSLEKKHAALLRHCKKKNKKTKASFELEWGFLDVKKGDKIWANDISDLQDVFLSETGLSPADTITKTIIDAGCGHGLMTSKIAGISKLAIGVEISKAVVSGYENNSAKNAWYVQADLQYLPFATNSFDVLYSSGVLHHTTDTELSLDLVEKCLTPTGRLCVWLYHPQKNRIHNGMLWLRKLTAKIPLRMAFYFIMVFIFPFTYLVKKIKNKNSPKFREEIIDLLDLLTPEFRFEIKHEEAIGWLEKRNYRDIAITTQNQFGFSIIGMKTDV